jgi:Leucine-rich repeat (LRR) protein
MTSHPERVQNNVHLMMSAHSKNSTNNQGISAQGFNNFTMRSQKSHNSGGTQGQYTNRGERLSIQ